MFYSSFYEVTDRFSEDNEAMAGKTKDDWGLLSNDDTPWILNGSIVEFDESDELTHAYF